MSEAEIFPQAIFLGAGCATLVLSSALAFVMMKKYKEETLAVDPIVEEEVVEELDATVSVFYVMRRVSVSLSALID
jgi:hypothetical protein